MEVYALVGQSGTGKSYKAFMVAKEKEIEYIIDDGLLIGGTRIIAGKSAKKEDTKIASVRRALFYDYLHRQAVRDALKAINPDKLLILGTSDKMIREICEALELPRFYHTIRIEDVSTDKEIELARKSRREDGKHVIPVPTFEIKKDFSGYFIDSLKIFNRKGRLPDIVVEKSIIRPTFSYLGKYEVSRTALVQLINGCLGKVERVSRALRIRIENKPTGIVIEVDIAIKLVGRIDKMVLELQKKIIEDVEYMTGMNVLSVNITVKAITGSI